MYAEALRAGGYRVTVRSVGGLRPRGGVAAAARPRSTSIPAYDGSLLRYLVGTSPARLKAGLRRTLARIDAVPMRLSRAQNRNVFVTKSETAARLGIAQALRSGAILAAGERARARPRGLSRAARGDRAAQPRVADVVRARQEDVRDVPRRPPRRRPAGDLVRGAPRACRRRSSPASRSTTSARRTSATAAGSACTEPRAGLERDRGGDRGRLRRDRAEVAGRAQARSRRTRDLDRPAPGRPARRRSSARRASRPRACARRRRPRRSGARSSGTPSATHSQRAAPSPSYGHPDAAGVDEADVADACGRPADACGRRRRARASTPPSAASQRSAGRDARQHLLVAARRRVAVQDAVELERQRQLAERPRALVAELRGACAPPSLRPDRRGPAAARRRPRRPRARRCRGCTARPRAGRASGPRTRRAPRRRRRGSRRGAARRRAPPPAPRHCRGCRTARARSCDDRAMKPAAPAASPGPRARGCLSQADERVDVTYARPAVRRPRPRSCEDRTAATSGHRRSPVPMRSPRRGRRSSTGRRRHRRAPRRGWSPSMRSRRRWCP